MSDDQFTHWKHAVAGHRIETERGNPRSGFYKDVTSKGVEVYAIYRDDAGKLQCIRTIFGDGSKMSADEIDELFGKVCLYPIAEDAFRAVFERSETLPPEYGTRLTMKDQAAGIAWTPEYGRRRLGLDLQAEAKPAGDAPPAQDAPDNPIAVSGHNQPPGPVEPVSEITRGHRLEGEQTPDKLAFAEASDMAAEVKRWLAEIGGKIRNKPEADRLSDYGTVLKRLAKKADGDRRAEKIPLEKQLKAIDERWKPAINIAEPVGKWCHDTSDRWTIEENRRLAEEAKKAAEAAAKDPSAPPAEPARQITGTGNIRTVTGRNREVWQVDDAKAFGTYLLGLDPISSDLLDVLRTIAQRIGTAGTAAPGISKTTQRSAA